MKVHGKGVEPLRLAAAEPKDGISTAYDTIPQDFAGSENGMKPDDATSKAALPRPAAASETTEAELEAAVSNVTRLLAFVDDPETAAELVAERRTMRMDLTTLRRAKAIDLDAERRARGRKSE